MTGEQGKYPPEVEQSLTPRQRLEKFLEGEKPYSIKSKAVADMVTQKKINSMILHYMPEGEIENGVLSVIRNIELIAKRAAVEETIRNHKIGENGIEYTDALEASSVLLPYYIDQSKYKEELTRRPGLGPIKRPEEHTISATQAIEADLLEINKNKSRQGK